MHMSDTERRVRPSQLVWHEKENKASHLHICLFGKDVLSEQRGISHCSVTHVRWAKTNYSVPSSHWQHTHTTSNPSRTLFYLIFFNRLIVEDRVLTDIQCWLNNWITFTVHVLEICGENTRSMWIFPQQSFNELKGSQSRRVGKSNSICSHTVAWTGQTAQSHKNVAKNLSSKAAYLIQRNIFQRFSNGTLNWPLFVSNDWTNNDVLNENKTIGCNTSHEHKKTWK